MWMAATVGIVYSEVVSTTPRGGGCTERVQEGSMKRYLKFAASFWVSAFLVAGSMAPAQTATTPKAKKKAGSSTTNTTAPTPTTGTTSSGQADNGTSAPSSDTSTTTPPAASAHDQSGTTTAPKTMVGPDKRTIPVPQL